MVVPLEYIEVGSFKQYGPWDHQNLHPGHDDLIAFATSVPSHPPLAAFKGRPVQHTVVMKTTLPSARVARRPSPSPSPSRRRVRQIEHRRAIQAGRQTKPSPRLSRHQQPAGYPIRAPGQLSDAGAVVVPACGRNRHQATTETTAAAFRCRWAKHIRYGVQEASLAPASDNLPAVPAFLTSRNAHLE